MTRNQFDQTVFESLQGSNPPAEDYLGRLGQINNNLMRMREVLEAESHIPTWLDSLGVEISDLLQLPPLETVLSFLSERGRRVQGLGSFPELEEQRHLEHDEDGQWEGPMEEHPNFWVDPQISEKLWELPSLQEQLTNWGTEAAIFQKDQTPVVSLGQAVVLMNVILASGSASPGQVEEFLQSALSSDFFKGM